MENQNYIEVNAEKGAALIRVDLIEAVCYNEEKTWLAVDGVKEPMFVKDAPATIVKKLREFGCGVL